MNELLRAIWDAPEDDDLRSVYADGLVAAGDPRGEMIQLQLQRGSLDAQARELELWRDHGPGWLGAFARYPAVVQFERGFPHALVGDADELRASAQLLREAPIRTLIVTSGLDERARDFAAMPELDRISILELDHGGTTSPMGDAGFAWFCATELPSLRALSVANQRLTVLPDAPWWRQLVRLQLDRNPLGSGGVGAIAGQLDRLRELDLAATGLGDRGMLALRGLALTSLRAGWHMGQPPRARHNRVTAGGLAGIARMASLRRLSLDHNELGRGAEVLVRLAELERLSLEACAIDDAGAAAIANGFPALQRLDLSGNEIGAAGAEALANAAGLGALIELGLAENRIGIAGVEALAHGTGLPQLRRLVVRDNQLHVDDALDEESLVATRARFRHRRGLSVG